MDFNTLQNLQEAYQEVSQLMELTGGKGHPGYKAGSRDLGPMQSGHPADTFKRTMKGGTMSMRHGDHLGDLDDKDDDEGDLEAGLKDTARKKRENVRKPLRDKVRTARRRMTKEDYELVMELTGGKGHPGYKAGSRDLGPMQDGHPADTVKRRIKGGTMSQRHGYHLGDIDDKDDDDGDEYESIVKQQSRDKRETVRKPLRDKVRAARKRMTKEDYELVMELTGGKGHPGYKAGSRDLGPMQSGHPADTFKRTMKGGTMSMRHGDHLGDLDDKDDDEGDLEAGLKDTARKKRENVRKPLRDKVKAARKRMTKEDYELDLFDYLLEYLVAEGYADTNKSALAIMANMSEQWKQSILEG